MQSYLYPFEAVTEGEFESPSSCFSEELALSEEVFEHISRLCPEDIVTLLGTTRLYEIVCSFSQCTVDREFVAGLIKENFDVHSFQSTEERRVLFNVEVVLKAAAIYFLSRLQENVFELYNTHDELLRDYPFLTKEANIVADPAELEFLLTFRNMMAIALTVIPGKCNKNLLLAACAMLEGSGRKYATGGTQSRATSIRVWIYEQESQCLPTRRSPVQPVEKKKSTIPARVMCSCGANILKRTSWKHQRSVKHTAFIAWSSQQLTNRKLTNRNEK